MEVCADMRLQHPFTGIVAGPTGCGKTTFILKLLQNIEAMIYPSPEKVYYCYGVFQEKFKEFPQNIEFIEGVKT